MPNAKPEDILRFLRTEATQAAAIDAANLPREIEEAKQNLDPTNPRTVYWLAVLLARPEAETIAASVATLLATLPKD
jgi:hypothetical protein